jgi:hypothetical protein
MSPNMERLLLFAIRYRGEWHYFGDENARSVFALERAGFVETDLGVHDRRWFRLIPSAVEEDGQ